MKDLDGRIKLEKVSFSYPSRADSPIFKDLSLSVDAGSTIAVVGESGSGKRFEFECDLSGTKGNQNLLK